MSILGFPTYGNYHMVLSVKGTLYLGLEGCIRFKISVQLLCLVCLPFPGLTAQAN